MGDSQKGTVFIMKKTVAFLLVCLMSLSFSACKGNDTTPNDNTTQAPKITLGQIADKFNSSETVLEQKELGQITTATVEGNEIIITTVMESFDTLEVKFNLSGNILSAEIDLPHAFQAIILVDCIGQLHGYSDGETYSTQNADEFESYTLEKEGVEMEDIDDERSTIRIDITKKFPLVDFSSVFIEVSDLQDKKKYISGGGSGQESKGNIIFFYKDGQKDGYDNEVTTLVIGDKDKLTENAYKSLLSILEVMFEGKEVVNYFKSQYQGFSEGNKEFAGFKIEISPVQDEWESFILGKKYAGVVRISIDKKQIR